MQAHYFMSNRVIETRRLLTKNYVSETNVFAQDSYYYQIILIAKWKTYDNTGVLHARIASNQK